MKRPRLPPSPLAQGKRHSPPEVSARPRSAAGGNLDCGAVVHARAGDLDAFASVAKNRTCAAILGFNDGRRVEVVSGVDRLGEAEVLAFSPVKRSRAAARPAKRIASDVGTVPNLLGEQIAVVGRIGHRLQIDIRRAAVRDLVFPAFPGKNWPEPSVTIGSNGGPPCAVVIALAVIVVIVAMDFALRNETFRREWRKSLKSLWAPNQRFRGIVCFQ